MSPPEAGAKYGQHFPAFLEEWDRTYRLHRNYVEGFNGYAKDPAFEDLGTPGRRRLGGLGAQAFLGCLYLVAANLRKIATFLAEAEASEDGVLVKRSPRKPSEHRLRYNAYFDSTGPPEPLSA